MTKRIIDSVDHDGKYFHIRASGINYKYIEADEVIDFIDSILTNASVCRIISEVASGEQPK